MQTWDAVGERKGIHQQGTGSDVVASDDASSSDPDHMSGSSIGSEASTPTAHTPAARAAAARTAAAAALAVPQGLSGLAASTSYDTHYHRQQSRLPGSPASLRRSKLHSLVATRRKLLQQMGVEDPLLDSTETSMTSLTTYSSSDLTSASMSASLLGG